MWKLVFYSLDGHYLNEVKTVNFEGEPNEAFEDIHEYVKQAYPISIAQYYYTITKEK